MALAYLTYQGGVFTSALFIINVAIIFSAIGVFIAGFVARLHQQYYVIKCVIIENSFSPVA